jgi:hypothetical protein
LLTLRTCTIDSGILLSHVQRSTARYRRRF